MEAHGARGCIEPLARRRPWRTSGRRRNRDPEHVRDRSCSAAHSRRVQPDRCAGGKARLGRQSRYHRDFSAPRPDKYSSGRFRAISGVGTPVRTTVAGLGNPACRSRDGRTASMTMSAPNPPVSSRTASTGSAGPDAVGGAQVAGPGQACDRRGRRRRLSGRRQPGAGDHGVIHAAADGATASPRPTWPVTAAAPMPEYAGG
jgi:hypothetical protein